MIKKLLRWVNHFSNLHKKENKKNISLEALVHILTLPYLQPNCPEIQSLLNFLKNLQKKVFQGAIEIFALSG